MAHHTHHNKRHALHASTDTRPQEATSGAQGATTDRIRLRAYELSQARKGGQGDALMDWTQAERELNAEGDEKH